MNVGEVLDRIAAGETGDSLESQALEFKTTGRSLADDLMNLAEACACMANSTGGTVIVGVSDKRGGTGAFTGHPLDADKAKHRIYEVTKPPLLVDAEALTTPHGDVLVLTVPRSSQVHAIGTKAPTERVGKHCVPMSADRTSVVVAEKTGLDWSAQDSQMPTGSVHPVAMEIARGFLERTNDPQRRRLAREQDIDLLRGVGVVTQRQTLTNAGALLFGPSHMSTDLISYVHRRTPAGRLTANEHLTGPLVVALQRAFDLVDARVERTPVTIGKGLQIHIADLPEAAIREAIVNATMHRSYLGGGRCTVEHSATQMKVSSPGGFVEGVTVANVLTTSSRSRNTHLSSAMRSLGLAETAGSGVDKMYAEMARVGHQPPRYAADASGVTVTLLGGAPNTALTRYVTTLPPEEGEDADTMLILLTLLTQKTVSADDLVPPLQKASVDEAQAVLHRLGSDSIKLLEPTRETARRAYPRYRLREEALAALGPAVAYRRRTTDQLDRKVVDLVRETGTINGRMVKILLDLDTVAASRLLGDLVDRGILVKTSEATRGPSVTYGPGTSFPKGSSKKAVEPRGTDRDRSQTELPLEGL